MKTILVLLFAAWVSSTAHSGELPSQGQPFASSTQAKRTLVEKALALKIGDSYQTVTNRLGVPTHDTRHQNKNGDWIGRSLKYSFHSQGADDLEGSFAESVVIFFDGHDLLRYVTLKVTLGDSSGS